MDTITGMPLPVRAVRGGMGDVLWLREEDGFEMKAGLLEGGGLKLQSN